MALMIYTLNCTSNIFFSQLTLLLLIEQFPLLPWGVTVIITVPLVSFMLWDPIQKSILFQEIYVARLHKEKW